MPSQPFLDRKASTDALRSAIHVFTAEVTAGLEARLRPVLRQGENLPDLKLLQELLVRAAEADLEEMAAGERTLEAAQEELLQQQEHRDSAAGDLRQMLLELGNLLHGFYDKEQLRAFKGRLARRPLALVGVGRGLLEKFDRPDLRLPPEKYPVEEAGFTPKVWLGKLSDRTEMLSDAIEDLAKAESRVTGARAERQRKLKAFNLRFPALAATLVSLYRLSGHDELASSFRPSGQDPGLTLSASKRRRALRRRSTEPRKATSRA